MDLLGGRAPGSALRAVSGVAVVVAVAVLAILVSGTGT